MKNKQHIAGLYFRLSQEDERQGESVSIENQRTILRKYAIEHGFKIHDEYIDDGISGTTFQRPAVQRLLDDAKSGVINTLIVKDLSRFGRNYIEVGQYIDYVFPTFGIRFIAIQDNVDTANRDSGTMEMMPIMNIFNEWHAATTSKKIRAVKQANAKNGIYNAKGAAYGYKIGSDKRRTPIVNEETAPTVKRIFEMYAVGTSPHKIAQTLNLEGVSSPSAYAYNKLGQKPRPNTMWLWTPLTIRQMLENMIYLGHMAQNCSSSISYKNHKRFRRDRSEWQIVYNNHEPIISQELWDKVQERKKSVAQGRKTKVGYTHPLSGFLFCADCGNKMKLCTSSKPNGKKDIYFNCGHHIRYGKAYCFSHYISGKTIEKIVLDDIRDMANKIILDEKAIREEFIRRNEELADAAIKKAQKNLQLKQKRVEELTKLIQTAYEDRVKGKMPEDICISFIEKYLAEQNQLKEEIVDLETHISETQTTKDTADDFIRNIKKFFNAPVLTREMCYGLIDRVIIGGLEKITGHEREIDIVYKVDITSALRPTNKTTKQ